MVEKVVARREAKVVVVVEVVVVEENPSRTLSQTSLRTEFWTSFASTST
jgi:hypothetical protein